MAIQSNFPAIRPSLLLDFANSKRLDPRITFTRASTARYYDGSTVAKAEENLLLRSQDYSATWTATSLTPVTGKTAPDGTSTATEFTASGANGTLTQSVTAIAADYTFSVWLRRVTGTGNIDISAHSGGTWVTQTISGTWARYTVTQTLTAGARTPGIRVVTSGDVIEVWGAQLEQRSAVTAYTATTTAPITTYVPVLQTAASGVPRFDHNPTTGESLGLLIEEARTNIATYSDDFANAAWTKTNSSITSNTVIAPDGTLVGDKLVEDATTNTHLVQRDVTVTSGTTYTVSVYMKKAERTFGRLRLGTATNGGTQVGSVTADLTTGTIATGSTPAGTSYSVVPVGNDWMKLTVTAAASGTTLNIICQTLTDATTNNYTGNGYSGIYLWGAQLEAGAFATSYIPTVAASATRQADAASMTGTNFSSWYDAAEGTVYYEAAAQFTGSATNTLVAIGDGTASNTTSFAFGSTTGTNPNFVVAAGGTEQANIALTPASTPTEFFRAAGAYKLNDIAACKNGGTVGTDTSALIPGATSDRLSFASRTARVKKLAYYPLRLTNAQLQAITG